MLIYQIVNKINGKKYVGKTELQTTHKRWLKHLRCVKNKENKPLYDSMNHYGISNFIIEVIEQCNNRKHLDEREKYWIAFYKTMDRKFGYNLTEGGTGGRASPEVYIKIGNKTRGTHHKMPKNWKKESGEIEKILKEKHLKRCMELKRLRY